LKECWNYLGIAWSCSYNARS